MSGYGNCPERTMCRSAHRDHDNLGLNSPRTRPKSVAGLPRKSSRKSLTSYSMKKFMHGYLQTARDVVVWKLNGLSEYDVRRPLVPSGTNLIGIVKHLTFAELGYFGPVFGRPMGQANLWFEDGVEDNADFFVRADDSRKDIVDNYLKACATSDATIEALELDAAGSVPWWGDQPVTLHQVLVHVIAETFRHAGHSDLVRELIDGSIGYAADDSNVPEHDSEWWGTYRDQLEREARHATN
jgi:hypothetical protein